MKYGVKNDLRGDTYMRLEDFMKIIDKEINQDTNVTLFIGAGFSFWYNLPNWKRLLLDFCNELERKYGYKNHKDIVDKIDNTYTIPRAFTDILKITNIDKSILQEYIANYLNDNKNINKRALGADLQKYKLLFNLSRNCRIITTNFDLLIENILRQIFKIKIKKFYYDTENLNKQFFGDISNKNELRILKLHGDIERPDTMVVTQDDYDLIISGKEYKLLNDALRSNFAQNINIFIGYSMRDENIKRLLLTNKNIYGKDKKMSFVINIVGEKIISYDYSIVRNQNDVEEICVYGQDEIITIFQYLQDVFKINKNKFVSDVNNFNENNITDNFGLQMEYLKALSLLRMRKYKKCKEVIEEIINQFEECNNTKWEYIYMIYGVLLDCENSDKKDEAEYYINKAIKLGKDKDDIYYSIAKTYLNRACVILHTSNISHNLSRHIIQDKKIVTRALKYFEKLSVKNREVNYHILDCYQKLGDYDKVF